MRVPELVWLTGRFDFLISVTDISSLAEWILFNRI